MQKKQYQAPVVEQMECKVERGFAGSQAAPVSEHHGTELLTEGTEYIFS